MDAPTGSPAHDQSIGLSDLRVNSILLSALRFAADTAGIDSVFQTCVS
jgi:hypothetical protein